MARYDCAEMTSCALANTFINRTCTVLIKSSGASHAIWPPATTSEPGGRGDLRSLEQLTSELAAAGGGLAERLASSWRAAAGASAPAAEPQDQLAADPRAAGEQLAASWRQSGGNLAITLLKKEMIVQWLTMVALDGWNVFVLWLLGEEDA